MPTKNKDNENTTFTFTGHLLDTPEQQYEREIKLIINCLELCGEVMLPKEKVIRMLKELLNDNT